ncbi:hypothetical protein DIPPA_30908 [Diplonema papillatum]|nr:hypothetical protein DIPPA_30908 [Diplonema papillatum]
MSSPKKRLKRSEPTPVTSASAARPDYLRMILTCPIHDVSKASGITKAVVLSEVFPKYEVFLKREDNHAGIFSHHLRTGYAFVRQLTEEQKRGAIVVSGHGNFTQAVAHALLHEGLYSDRVFLYVSKSTPRLLCRHLHDFQESLPSKAHIVIDGRDLDEAAALAAEKAEATGGVHINPFDGITPIAALGSIGVEIFRQIPHVGRLYIGVGTGAMFAAILEYAAHIHPDIEIVGIEAQGNQTFSTLALSGPDRAGIVESSAKRNHFVESTALDGPNGHALNIVRHHLARAGAGVPAVRFLSVDDDDVCSAIKSVFLDTRSILEPAGALAVAGMKQDLARESAARAGEPAGTPPATVAAVLSGANIEFNLLREVAQRCEENEVLVSVTLPEEKGSFRKMYEQVTPCSVTEFSYRYSSAKQDAMVIMSFEASDAKVGEEVVQKLNASGFRAEVLTNNAMAKEHARYLVGGRGAPPDERLLQFSFPETTGALSLFLAELPGFVNITLFHYRNHGSDFGKVLVGFDVPVREEVSFQNFLTTVSYAFVEETTNPVYRLFLR